MKKTSILLSALLFAAVYSNAQCVATDNFISGTLEVSTSEFAPVYACADCGDHTRILSVQSFADTTLSVVINPDDPALEVTVFADRFRLDSIGGLPAGLTYTTNSAFDTTYDAIDNPFGYWVNPGDTVSGFESTIGCISIEGSAADWTAAAGGGPNNDGAYPLTVYIDARAADFLPVEIADVVGYNTWLTDMGFLLDAFGDPNFTDNGIRLENAATLQVFASGVGVDEEATIKSSLTISPNPADSWVNVMYTADKQTANTVIKVLDLKGRLALSSKTVTGVGNNNHRIDITDLVPGIYLLSVQSESFTVAQKLVIQ